MATDGAKYNDTGKARLIIKGAVQRFVNSQPVPAAAAGWGGHRVAPDDPREQTQWLEF